MNSTIRLLRLSTVIVGVLASGIVAYVNFFMPIHVKPFLANPSIVLYFYGWPYTAFRNYDSYYEHVAAGFVNNSGGFWGEGWHGNNLVKNVSIALIITAGSMAIAELLARRYFPRRRNVMPDPLAIPAPTQE